MHNFDVDLKWQARSTSELQCREQKTHVDNNYVVKSTSVFL